MTNPEIYPYQPQFIKTVEKNEHFLAVVEDFLSRPHLTPEENTLLELLVSLIEDFENQHYSINASTPRSRILHLLEAQDLEVSNLVPIFGLIELVDKVINGDVEVTKEQGEMLGNLFHVDASLFIE
ncbi:transcriptional regulator [Cuspidothrix issatschenkoi LEGE 03284]|uniref:helix-turn-helix domain-containing protein n=1 Tax=Cuspidothrix issatschenkoi TaxID=230752 RepID=UPI0018804DF9|nr:transcriptional regulator [Cuspidothrix issatschenkoi]MBE9231609.1 transcriptional regulator [Cuspidothrix issatschenkoi LEGE 03284]